MFNLRTYGKAELALLYQPFSTPESAVKTLNRWINGCPLLLEELIYSIGSLCGASFCVGSLDGSTAKKIFSGRRRFM